MFTVFPCPHAFPRAPSAAMNIHHLLESYISLSNNVQSSLTFAPAINQTTAKVLVRNALEGPCMVASSLRYFGTKHSPMKLQRCGACLLSTPIPKSCEEFRPCPLWCCSRCGEDTDRSICMEDDADSSICWEEESDRSVRWESEDTELSSW